MYFSRCVRINREFLTITIFRAIAFSKVIFFLEKQIYSQPFTSSSIKLSITRFQSKSWRSNNPMKTRGLNDYISSRSTNNNESCFIQRKLVFWLVFALRTYLLFISNLKWLLFRSNSDLVGFALNYSWVNSNTYQLLTIQLTLKKTILINAMTLELKLLK